MIATGNPPRSLEIERRDGGCLAGYHWAGSGPFIAAHPGSWSDYRQFDAVRAHLDKDLNLAILELPGHGRSWPPTMDGTIEGLARETLRLTDQMGWKSWFAGGHSIGGMIAIELAGQRPRELPGVISLEGWTHHQVLGQAFSGQVDTTLSEDLEQQRLEARGADPSPAEPGSNRGLSLHLAALGRPPHSGVDFRPGAGGLG